MKGCQACLQVVEDSEPVFYLSDIYLNPSNSFSDAISIKDKLADCVPELLLDTANNGVLCQSCVISLMAAYDFRQQCLEAQHKIYGYLQQMPINTEIDMEQIALYYKRLAMIAEGGNPLADSVDKSATDIPRNETGEALPANVTVGSSFNRDVMNDLSFPTQIRVEPNEDLEIGNGSTLSSSSNNRRAETSPAVVKVGHVPYLNQEVTNDQLHFLQPVNIQPNFNYAVGNKRSPVSSHGGNKTSKTSTTQKPNKGKKSQKKAKKRHPCRLCEQTFSNLNQLDMHVNTHSTKFVKCQSCRYKCSSRFTLQRHERVHNGHYPVQCRICHFRFKTPSDLDAHLRSKHSFSETGAPSRKIMKKNMGREAKTNV